MDLKAVRQERLKEFARSRGVLDDPSGLAEAIGKKPNQVYNLLHGSSSFGEKVARSIEEHAGLPRYWLDVDAQTRNAAAMLSPEAVEIARAIDTLSGVTRNKVINSCRQILDLAQGRQGGQGTQQQNLS